MGVNTIPTRSEQAITSDWFNVLKAVLCLDLVPRNASGIVTALGGSLGTADYNWSAVFAKSLVVDGATLDTSSFTTKPHRIASGKAKTSGFPNYLTPAGSGNGLTATLDASTDFEVTINNTALTIDSNIVFSSLAAAPSTNNTALVNDSNLSGAEATKYIGEFDSSPIAIDTIGTEISDLDGTIAAFKTTGGEIILARIDTTGNAIYPILRGWAGTDRGTISNDDTLTLLKVNTLVLKSDGVSKFSSTYFPESVSEVPASDTNGKVYFERSTGKQGYDDGTTVSYDYIVVGYAVCDTTDCLNVEPIDFDKSWSDEGSVRLKIKSTTVLTVLGGSYASVAAKAVVIHSDLDASTATDLDTDETLSADTLYFLYLKPDGSLTLSTVSPRRDEVVKKAGYHPTEYWRCIGATMTNASSEIGGKKKEPLSRDRICDALVPIGAIVPVVATYYGDSSNGTGVDAYGNSVSALKMMLSDGWAVCDGSLYRDDESPIFNGSGRHLPNLTDDRFIMGDTVFGDVGGANSVTPTASGTQSIAHTHNIAHVHQWGYKDTSSNVSTMTTLNDSVSTFNESTSGSDTWLTDRTVTDGSSASVAYLFVDGNTWYTGGVLSPPNGSAGASASSGAMSANSSVDFSNAVIAAVDNKPAYLSAIYVMRVK